MRPEIDVDISALTPAERRLLAGLVPLLNPLTEGMLRLHEIGSKIPAAMLWRMQPDAAQTGVLQLIHPGGQVRATLTRPIVLGAVKRMLNELAQGSAPRIASPRVQLDQASQPMAAVTKIRQMPFAASSDAKTPVGSGDETDPRAYVGNYSLTELLDALRIDQPGTFDVRFPTKETIRIDRGNHSFRCRGFNRNELYHRLAATPVSWVQLSDKQRAKTDETQASMAPLLFVLGVITAKERFIAGTHTELEFQIPSTVGYGRFADFERIALAFAQFSPVPDAAVKLSVAPVEILACLNGYAAVSMLKTRPRQVKESKEASKTDADKGFFSRLFSKN